MAAALLRAPDAIDTTLKCDQVVKIYINSGIVWAGGRYCGQIVEEFTESGEGHKIHLSHTTCTFTHTTCTAGPGRHRTLRRGPSFRPSCATIRRHRAALCRTARPSQTGAPCRGWRSGGMSAAESGPQGRCALARALWHGRDVPPKGGNALGTWRGRGGGGGNAHGRREKERRGGKRDAARGTRGIYISPPRKCSRPENVTTTAPKTLPILLHTS